MDKIKVGIPRSLYYYYYGKLLVSFFKNLDFEVVLSPKTNKDIMDLGIKYATDEMCLSLKNYIGHVAYLSDKVDYIVIPRIDNFYSSNQTCTNFLSTYDIINNLFDVKILNYNIDLNNRETEFKGFLKMGLELDKPKEEIKVAYNRAKIYSMNYKERLIRNNMSKLMSKKIKILIVGHPYNLYDDIIGKPILDYLKNNDIEIIYSNLFDENKCLKLSENLSKELYFKYNKENIGSIEISKTMIDGIIFLTTFPCGPDSLVNELVIRKINIPHIQLIIDDLSSDVGLETRLESFLDILKEKVKN